MRISTILTGGLMSLALAGTAMAAPHGVRADLDKDGNVTRAELNAQIDQRFKAIDANANGQIDAAEMQAAHAQRKAKRAERHEARQGEHAGRHSGEKRQAKRGQIDADGDGIITRAEFGAKAIKRFERADANADGVVSQDERAAMREARKARRG